jgi:type I restriction enzyme, S subunit
MSSISKKQKNAPRLRFPGFNENWKNYTLQELVQNVGGTALESHTSPIGTHKFISIGNYSTVGTYIDNGQRVNLNEKTKTKLLDKDNLVMVLNDKTTSGDIIGSTILIDKSDSYIYNQRSERLICRDQFLPKYAWVYLNSPHFRNRIVKMAQGGTQIYVNFPSVKKESIALPERQEQQKIADFLGSVDAWLDNLRQQKTALETYKRGMMQKLFTQQIRFKNDRGKDFPEWQEKRLGNLFKDSGDGGTPATDKSSFYGGSIKWATIDDIVPLITDTKKKLTEDGLKYSSAKIWPIGSIILSTGATIGEVGIAGVPITTKQGIVGIVVDQNLVSNIFMRYWFLNNRNLLLKFAQGGTIKEVRLPTIKKFVLLMPSLPEQQKITEFLTSLDESITAKAEVITKAVQWKNGLMQKMLV